MFSRTPVCAILAVAAVAAPAYADNSKNAFNKGVKAEQTGDFEAAFNYYKQAWVLSPENSKYLAAYIRVRFTAASQHLHSGETLRKSGALKDALVEFEKAAQIDPTLAAAQQEVINTTEMIRRGEQAKVNQEEESAYAKLPDNVGVPLHLKPLSAAPITMYMTANADAVYRAIGKIAGLNVVVDPDYRPQKITVDLTNVTLLQALDLVRLQSKTFWRPVLENTIFVSADSPTKRKDLEQSIMKTFYLRNVESATELQDAANAVKQMLDLTHVQLVQAQDALILRGSPDQLTLAETLLSNFDRPKSEVVVDVAVMEVSRDKLRTLGTNPPTSFSGSLVPPTSSSSSGSGSTGGFVASQLSHLGTGNLVVTIPGASLSVLASDSNAKILQNPEIRVLNNEKATLRIGDRVPYATGSFAPGISGGGGISPLVSTQFQYLDVGVNIDITPHIHANGEVTLKLSLEISSVTGNNDIGGISEPVIGQRKIEHETRLQDGEVSLLGGILEDTETQSMSGYPWITKIPILKYLFGQDNRERKENEIVFAITPHIVRLPDTRDVKTREIEVGTGNSIELRRTSDATIPDATKQAEPPVGHETAPTPAHSPAVNAPPHS